MTRTNKNIDKNPELTKQVEELASVSTISWNKTKDQIWMEMLEKIDNNQPIKTKSISIQMRRLAVAASILALIGIPVAMLSYTKTIQTTHDELAFLLPDQSHVTLASQSMLSYKPLIWEFSRKVKFVGKAFFEVEPGRKFEVVSAKGKTVVLGTQFIIYSRVKDYQVTCLSGKVKVVEFGHQNEAIITKGEKATLKPDGTFEIASTFNSGNENKTKPQSNTIESELNEVLTPASLPIKANNKIQDNRSLKKPMEVNKTKETEKLKSDQSNKTSEQNGILNQAPKEELINTEPAKEKVQTRQENEEQNQNRVQAKGNQTAGEKFRNSLTPEQINILEDQQMSREEKRKVFLKSLSPEQQKLLDEQNKERAQQNNVNQTNSDNNSKEQQKTQLREQLREKPGEEKEQLKQQNRENSPTEKGNNPGNQGDSKNTGGKGN